METVMADTKSNEPPLGSPFALMFPDAARQIAKRAAALDLPTRQCSPLSMQRAPGAPGARASDDDDED
jgi:hypothetical protein